MNTEFETKKYKFNLFFFFFNIVSLNFLLYGNRLFRLGAHLDGMTYGAISRNLSIGLGSFWNPYYTLNSHSNFREHPPLFFWVQSVFFSIADTNYTEKVFAFLVYISIFYLSYKIIKFLEPQISKRLDILFLFFLFFTISPTTRYLSYSLLEPLMLAFDLLAIYFFLCSFRKSANTTKIIYATLAIVFICLAFLTKGFVGLFPLIFPFLYYIFINRKFDLKRIFTSFWPFLAFSSIAYLVYSNFPYIKDYFDIYIEKQVKGSISGVRSTEQGSYSFLYVVKKSIEILLPAIILILAQIIRTKSFAIKNKDYFCIGLLFLTVGLSASLPLAVSSKLRGFYFIPASPFLTIGGVFVFLSLIKSSLSIKKYSNFLFYILAPTFITYLIYSSFQLNKPYKKKEDIHELSNYLKKHYSTQQTISTCKYYEREWYLVATLQRFNRITIVQSHKSKEEQSLYVEKEICAKNDLSSYKLIKELDGGFKIFQKL